MIGKCNTGGGENLSEVIATQKQLLTDMGNLLDTKGAYLQQTKTVTSVPEGSEINPDEGYLLSKVVIEAVPSQTKTVIPTSKNITVSPDSGKLLSEVVVNGDSDLIPQNIKSGIDIFGVIGTFNNNSGIYLWNKYNYTSNTKGDWVDYVVSGNSSEYPNGAVHTDGYWYEISDTANLTVKTGTINGTGRVNIETKLGKPPKYYGVSTLNASVFMKSSTGTVGQNNTADISVTSSDDTLVVSTSIGRYGLTAEVKSLRLTWFAIG